MQGAAPNKGMEGDVHSAMLHARSSCLAVGRTTLRLRRHSIEIPQNADLGGEVHRFHQEHSYPVAAGVI